MPYNELDGAEFGGAERRFGTMEQTPGQLTMATPVFGDDDKSPPLILEAQWAPTWQAPGDNNDQYSNGIGDQEDQGACGAITGAELVESAILKAGMPAKKLSWGQLYWSVNGGSDSGSLPESVLKRIRTFGVASIDTCPLNIRNSRNNDLLVIKDAQNYAVDEWFLAPTIAHLVSGLIQGYSCHSSLWWYGNDNVNSSGWLSDRPSGKKGGHSIRINEFIIENGRQGFRFPNTWTTRWGVNGYGKVSVDRIRETMKVWPFWLVRSVRQQDGRFPPPRPPIG